MSIVHNKKEARYLRSVSEIIANEVTNVNISDTTVTGVKLSNDDSHLNVYVVFSTNKERSMKYLNKSKSFVRKRLAQGSRQRRVPDIHFLHDESQEKGSKIDQLLQEIKNGNLNQEK
ncbi:30S ribosome-binding factor RbfA [Candidatus Mycoplasma mahonii]|uniref:30S ribosome-binding factor RbfA n=1 Tax=Candidatus Mycoplasma mahonii TaxID=3004105 RepID=UPI0026EA8992|nr:30S ribosome-binding factor RbfA [Candidatus Mycoplasma mahonii]WKX02538.1 30S ribosome-binding factor RbfA [Candidatus Mycoplasma mahonii]